MKVHVVMPMDMMTITMMCLRAGHHVKGHTRYM